MQFGSATWTFKKIKGAHWPYKRKILINQDLTKQSKEVIFSGEKNKQTIRGRN